MVRRERLGVKPVQLTSLFAVNGLVYGLSALYYCFIQLYLGTVVSVEKMGIILAIGQIVGTAGPIIWGVSADRAKYKNSVLMFAVVGCAVSYYAMVLSDTLWWLTLMNLITMFFMSPFGGILDTITIEYCYSNKIKYGTIRLAGTVVYGVFAFVLSLYIKNNINLIFPVYAGITALCAVLMLFMPKVRGMASGKKDFNLKPLLKDKTLMAIVLLSTVASFAWGYYLNFFPGYMTATLGMPESVWGLNVMLTVVGEIPFFLLFSRVFGRFGVKKVLVTVIIMTIIRYALLGFVTASWAVLVVGVLTGGSITVFIYCGSIYINDNIPEELHASAQTMIYAIGQSAPRIIASFAGGFLTSSLGVPAMLYICSGASVVTLIAFFFTVGNKRFTAGSRI